MHALETTMAARMHQTRMPQSCNDVKLLTHSDGQAFCEVMRSAPTSVLRSAFQGYKNRESCLLASLLTLGAHAQRGLQYLVCVSVCVCVRRTILAPRAITRQTRDTSDFSVTCAAKLKRRLIIILKTLP